MPDLRQSTAVVINFGPFVDKGDGVTPETASTGMTVKLSKNGGTMAARNSATAITHDADGYYKVALNATDTNTLGLLKAMATDASTFLPVWDYFTVLSISEYDRKYAATFTLQAGASSTATLDAGASAVDNYYVPQTIRITGGTGAGQSRRIISYVGSTKVATVDTAWATTVDNTSTYELDGVATGALTAVERTAIGSAVLTSATAAPIAADIQAINAVTIVGDGSGTPWGP